jgi:N,N'-diacetyllegionaminate synthase
MVELVAEVGSNHNGDAYTAAELIRVAAKAGASTVKFQHYPDGRYGPNAMPKKWLRVLNEFASVTGVGFLCSVFDQRTLEDYLTECAPTSVKIASPELTDHELLRACANAGLHIILSTGMSTEEQIAAAVSVIEDYRGRVTLLHCVSSYPSPPEEMNLRAMWRLKRYGKIGLSDHTLDPVVAPVTAVALGATMIEKHFTLNRSQDGPDHSYAVDPAGFKAMVDAVRLCESMLGDGVKRVMPSEDPTDRRTEEWRAA